MNNDYFFLTGGTGLLGRFLIRDLLLQGTKLALLVRGTKKESAQERLEANPSTLGKPTGTSTCSSSDDRGRFARIQPGAYRCRKELGRYTLQADDP